MCCQLEDLLIEKDNEDLDAATNARRVIVSHVGSNETPPGLFLFEKPPLFKSAGPFFHFQKFRSTLDIWFEDRYAMDVAFDEVEMMIIKAKARRGHLLRSHLRQGEGSDAQQKTYDA